MKSRFVSNIDDKLTRCGLKSAVIKAFKFLVHFILVMVLLYCSAMVLARLEDPEIMYGKDTNASNTTHNREDIHAKKGQNLSKGISLFWTNMEAKYNVSVHDNFRDALLHDINNFIEQSKGHSSKRTKTNQTTNAHDKHFIFMKWFYFVIISTTTIGYGDVSPKTNDGKLFFIFFLIIGIALMVTLLKSCGSLLTAANKRFYAFVNRYLCRNKSFVSDELMSVVSMVFIFFLFMLFVAWHDQNISSVGEWSMIDNVYFWLVTFTTVGFGDLHFPLEVEIEHFYELVVYRVFGLSFLAGIIESIHCYIKYRKLILIRENLRKLSWLKESFLFKRLQSKLPMTEGFMSEFAPARTDDDFQNDMSDGK